MSDTESTQGAPVRVLCLATASMLAQVRVLGRSLARHHPDWELRVAPLGPEAERQAEGEFDVIPVSEVLDVDIEHLLMRHTLEETFALLIPRLLLRHCRGRHAPTFHFPASAWVVGDLSPIVDRLSARSVVLFPRLRHGIPDDGLQPTGTKLRESGAVASDFIGVSGSTPAAGFLRWWIGRLDATLGTADGRHPGHLPDRRYWVYRNLETGLARPEVSVVEGDGTLLSEWNLHEHTITGRPGAVRTGDGREVRLLDLRDFEPDHPWRLSAGASRVRLSRSPALQALCLDYARELTDAGWRELSHRRYLGRSLANGVVFDDTLERLFVVAQTLGIVEEPLSPEGTEAFMDWLGAPAERGIAPGVTRYLLYRVVRERPDVVAAFPDLAGADGPRLITWAHLSGVTELGIPPELLPPLPGSPEDAAIEADVARDAPATLGAAAAPAAPPAPTAEDTIAVRVSGYLGHVLGLGAAARAYTDALGAAGVPLSTVTVSLAEHDAARGLDSGYGRHDFDELSHGAAHGFELICVNPDELPEYVASVGPDHLTGTRIGVWGWETNSIPARWAPAYSLVDEIWVYSRFVAENLRAAATVPVVALPPPVRVPSAAAPIRLGVPEGFLFLYVFDYASTVQRKNPVGLVHAFRQAFTTGEGPQLLIKTINAPLAPLGEDELLWAAGDRPDIHIVDRSLPAEERDGLMAACDCYVSLHRSEGFGLTIAEAMALGKPVIATAYSGNLDFMDAQNSLLVDYTLTRVGPDCPIYPPDGEWAEPDIEHAARLMRHVHDHPEEAAAMGQRARAHIATALSPQATGTMMRRRLEELASVRGSDRRSG